MRAILFRQCPMQSQWERVQEIFYTHAQVTNGWKARRKWFETKWTQPTDCLGLWVVELIEEQYFSAAGTESNYKITVHRTEEVTALVP